MPATCASSTPDAIDRAVAALDRFRQVAEVHGAPITAVATSAVREADNRDDLIDRAWEEARVAVNVISGVEEARLIHLGVLQAVPVYDRRLLLVRHRGREHRAARGPARRGAVVSLAEARRDPPDAAVLRRQAHAPGGRRRLSPARALHDRAVRPRDPQPRCRGRRRLVRHHRHAGRDGGDEGDRHAAALGQQPHPHDRPAGRPGRGHRGGADPGGPHASSRGSTRAGPTSSWPAPSSSSR